MKILLTFLTLSYMLASYGQFYNNPFKELEKIEFIVTYGLKYAPDSLNPNKISQENMLLFLGKNISKYVSYNFYTIYNEGREMEKKGLLDEWFANREKGTPPSRFLNRIYKNYPVGKITTTAHVIGASYIYTEELNSFVWKICADTATITGYKTQKASCVFGGRSWVAWFAPEIAYRDGPYSFYGLPGLIVKLHDTRNHYAFELISIEKPKEPRMIEFIETGRISTSKKGFFKAEDDFRADIINRAKAAGFTNDDQQIIARNLQRNNNPIELDRK